MFGLGWAANQSGVFLDAAKSLAVWAILSRNGDTTRQAAARESASSHSWAGK